MSVPPAALASRVLFRWPLRVYYEDTDAGGVVYYANYLKVFERCRTEWLRAVGVDQRTLAAEHGLMFVVVRAEIDYKRPARLADLLEADMHVAKLARVSFEFTQNLTRGAELLAALRVKVACVDSRTLAPKPLPDVIAAPLKAFAP
ncbi:MAG: tol-pal system-associated acyl-CoA thioesterase [Betaproteobacteria bacterium]